MIILSILIYFVMLVMCLECIGVLYRTRKLRITVLSLTELELSLNFLFSFLCHMYYVGYWVLWL